MLISSTFCTHTHALSMRSWHCLFMQTLKLMRACARLLPEYFNRCREEHTLTHMHTPVCASFITRDYSFIQRFFHFDFLFICSVVVLRAQMYTLLGGCEKGRSVWGFSRTLGFSTLTDQLSARAVAWYLYLTLFVHVTRFYLLTVFERCVIVCCNHLSVAVYY